MLSLASICDKVERQAAAEASPRLVITERGTSRKSMLTSLIQSRDHVSPFHLEMSFQLCFFDA